MTTTTAINEDVMTHHADCADWTHADWDDCELDSWDGPNEDTSYILNANPGEESGPHAMFALHMEAGDAGDLDAVLDALAELTRRAESLKRRMA
mgnify:FL=1